MKIFSFLFVAAIALISFNSFTTEPTNPTDPEKVLSNCEADCFFTSCNISCDGGSPGGGGTACTCAWGFATCACVEVDVVVGPDPTTTIQQANFDRYTDLLDNLTSNEAANVKRIAGQMKTLLKGGVSKTEIPTYHRLVTQHSRAVESLPRAELTRVKALIKD